MADGDVITVGTAKFQEVSMIPRNILLRNETVAVGDIRYSRNLPSYLRLECVSAGTTGTTEPDYSSMSQGGGQ